MDTNLSVARDLVQNSGKITILTGAGISTESGIADFRSPGGVWARYRSVTIQEFMADSGLRKHYWKYKYETIPPMMDARPNAAHLAVGDLYKNGKLLMLITQNIDGLHEKGGVGRDKIVNIHGTNSEAVCLSCQRVQDIGPVLDRIAAGDDVPLCRECGGLLKPNTISFGQNLVREHLVISEKATRECDLFMALGSSLVVQPAASFVEVAHRHGKKIIIMNRDETPYDSLADIRLTGSLGEVLPRLVR